MPAQQRQRQLVIPVQAGPAAVHAGDKRGPTNITGARPDKLALGGIKVSEQTSQMIEVINRRRWGVGSGTGFEIMGMGHRRDSVLTFCLI